MSVTREASHYSSPRGGRREPRFLGRQSVINQRRLNKTRNACSAGPAAEIRCRETKASPGARQKTEKCPCLAWRCCHFQSGRGWRRRKKGERRGWMREGANHNRLSPVATLCSCVLSREGRGPFVWHRCPLLSIEIGTAFPWISVPLRASRLLPLSITRQIARFGLARARLLS